MIALSPHILTSIACEPQRFDAPALAALVARGLLSPGARSPIGHLASRVSLTPALVAKAMHELALRGIVDERMGVRCAGDARPLLDALRIAANPSARVRVAVGAAPVMAGLVAEGSVAFVAIDGDSLWVTPPMRVELHCRRLARRLMRPPLGAALLVSLLVEELAATREPLSRTFACVPAGGCFLVEAAEDEEEAFVHRLADGSRVLVTPMTEETACDVLLEAHLGEG